ncbi:MAG TPA: hypothetical protein PKD05_00530 [Candidatus Melainabacteria bacterium]|nr:hypothetical protein [Candidatus Melainabacteria bacterium]
MTSQRLNRKKSAKTKYRLSYRTRRRRSEDGSALSEMAPGLFLLIFFGLFLVVDVIALGFNYCSCVTLNDLQIREAAKLPRSMAIDATGPVKTGIPAQWKNSVVGAVSGVPAHPDTKVEYITGAGGVYVKVTTVATVNPLITIPVFPGIPALGAPATLSVTNMKLIENLRSVVQ